MVGHAGYHTVILVCLEDTKRKENPAQEAAGRFKDFFGFGWFDEKINDVLNGVIAFVITALYAEPTIE